MYTWNTILTQEYKLDTISYLAQYRISQAHECPLVLFSKKLPQKVGNTQKIIVITENPADIFTLPSIDRAYYNYYCGKLDSPVVLETKAQDYLDYLRQHTATGDIPKEMIPANELTQVMRRMTKRECICVMSTGPSDNIEVIPQKVPLGNKNCLVYTNKVTMENGSLVSNFNIQLKHNILDNETGLVFYEANLYYEDKVIPVELTQANIKNLDIFIERILTEHNCGITQVDPMHLKKLFYIFKNASTTTTKAIIKDCGWINHELFLPNVRIANGQLHHDIYYKGTMVLPFEIQDNIKLDTEILEKYKDLIACFCHPFIVDYKKVKVNCGYPFLNFLKIPCQNTIDGKNIDNTIFAHMLAVAKFCTQHNIQFNNPIDLISRIQRGA